MICACSAPKRYWLFGAYFCSVFLPIFTILNNQNRFPPRTKSFKIVYLQKRNLYLNQFSNKKGPLLNLRGRKSTLSGPQSPVPTFSLRNPPRRFPRSFVSSERVLGLPSLIDSSKVSITIMFTLYNIPWSYKWAIIVSDSLAGPKMIMIIAKSSIKTGYSISGKHPPFWGGYLVFIVCQNRKFWKRVYKTLL